jgi:hypothetical protein
MLNGHCERALFASEAIPEWLEVRLLRHDLAFGYHGLPLGHHDLVNGQTGAGTGEERSQ